MAEGLRIRSWIFYLSLVVFVAAVVIAIALPVTFAKQSDEEVTRTTYSYRHNEIPVYSPIPNEDPFEIWGTSQKARDAYAKLGWPQKIGQTSLFAFGDASGPGGSDGSDWAGLIRENVIGSLINIPTYEDRVEYSSHVPDDGIPILYGFDTIHGYQVLFPINLGMAAAWSPEVIKDYTRVAAYETKADGVPWTFAPMVDLARDARWGRIMEGGGEDPWLSGTLSRAYVEEFQRLGVASCVKHFAGYGFPVGGVDYTGAHIDDAQMFNDYMRVYDIAIRDENPNMSPADMAWTVMGAFNIWEGVPCHASKSLMTDVLRGKYSFKGFVVADYRAVDEIVQHGVAADCAEAGRMAIYAGVDMNMQDGCHNMAFMTIDQTDIENPVFNVNMTALNMIAPDGRPYTEHVDLAVRRIIAIKDKLGLFEQAMPPTKEPTMKDEHYQVAQEVAEKTMVLLQNKDSALPIPKSDSNRIVIGGRIAGSVMDQIGFWFGRGREPEPLFRMKRYHLGLDEYVTENGYGVVLNVPRDAESTSTDSETLSTSTDSESSTESSTSTDSESSTESSTSTDSESSTESSTSTDSEASSTDPEPEARRLQAAVDYVFGYRTMMDYQPEALATGIHDFEIEDDEKAHNDWVDLLRREMEEGGITHVVATLGENVTMTGESASRADISLSSSQIRFIREIVEIREEFNADFKIIGLYNVGRPVVFSQYELDNLDAIIMSWCAGSMAGSALPRLLFGDIDFSAKTPVSFARNNGQIPIYYGQDHLPRGPSDSWEEGGDYQPQLKIGEDTTIVEGAEYSYSGQYVDSWNSPLYPFGFGLHYYDFTYSNGGLSMTTAPVDSTEIIAATVTLTRANTEMPSAEIVQVYMSPRFRQPVPPKKKLIGYQRVEFAAGESTKDVTIDIPIQRHFSYYNHEFEKVVTPGVFDITIGKNVNDNFFSGTFTLTE